MMSVTRRWVFAGAVIWALFGRTVCCCAQIASEFPVATIGTAKNRSATVRTDVAGTQLARHFFGRPQLAAQATRLPRLTELPAANNAVIRPSADTNVLSPSLHSQPPFVDKAEILPQPSSASGKAAWWDEMVVRGSGSNELRVSVEQLLLMAVAHSGRIQAVALAPHIAQAKLQQATAFTDPTLFSESNFNRTNDPVESTLQTGGPPRLEDRVIGLDAGLRGKRSDGLSYSLGQRIGFKDSNSNFFSPANQATSRIRAGLTKPLLRGRITDVQRTLVLATSFETEAAAAEYAKELQQQLYDIAETYWSLYFEHASRWQRLRHIKRAQEIAAILESRASLDAVQSQIYRVKAAVTNRQAELATVDATIRNHESRLRALVNAPQMLQNRQLDFVPVQPPAVFPIELNLESEVQRALQARPELADLNAQVGIAQAKLNLAHDQMKAKLDFVGEAYIAGLQGNNDVANAWSDQFNGGTPGVSAGLVFERPAANRSARGAVQEREFELAQLGHLLREMNETIRADVESAVRDISAASTNVSSRHESLAAANQELDYLQDRWKMLGDDPNLGQVQLNDLFQAQDRVLQEEQGLLLATIDFHLAILDLQKATGAFVRFARCAD
ncbi:MAG: TolC family protein [Planctomycetales bacterium]|nr:TolC family protein [Planctomycetales bacterium]